MYQVSLTVSRNVSLAITIVLFIVPFGVFGQYYPAPKPENPVNEHNLLSQLAGASGKQRVDVLLRLTNLYLNKPMRRDADMKRALVFGNSARDSSIKYNDKKRTEEAQL